MIEKAREINPVTGKVIHRRPNHKRKKKYLGVQSRVPIPVDGPPQVYAYVRVSTDRQDQSPADQRTMMQDLAQHNGLTIDAFFQDAPTQNKDGTWNDAQSGKIPIDDRPAGNEMCRRLRPGDVVIVSKMDRLFRKLSDCVVVLDRWERVGVRLLAGDFPMLSNLADPYAKALLQMMAVFAELNRKLIVQRVKEAHACRKREGKAINRYAGYGFKYVDHYDSKLGKKVKVRTADPDERAIMAQIVKWRLEGNTWEQMYWHLQRLGIKTRVGTEWSVIRIWRVFQAELQLQLNENTNTR
jgi:DNA invertase Pin-like site-specific DNA recombinase